MSTSFTLRTLRDDFIAGIIVFFVALPLCLGVAFASNVPLFSGLLAGIIGGIVIGTLSGSSVSVSGPSASLTAVVAIELQKLGSLEAFLVAVVIAGVIQLFLGAFKLGFIAGFFPTSVIKGLLWAIGLILVLKQIPHLIGHDADPMGNESFAQINQQNTFSELKEAISDYHLGAAFIGFSSLALLAAFEFFQSLKKAKVIAPLLVIVMGVLMSLLLSNFNANWRLELDHLVQVPIADTLKESLNFLIFPDFTALQDADLYPVIATIALIISLETLLNLEALDKIDPLKRDNPPNRELLAQGVGNVMGGLMGALPMTSVIIRSSVNIHSGAKTKLSTIFHGVLMLIGVLLVPQWLNIIPLSTLAAILIMTGLKLASPAIVMQLWQEGKYQFLPFIFTIIAIVFTDLLTGISIGLAIAICFILHSNIRRPLKKTLEKHATGDEVLHIELPNQVSFFNRVALENSLKSIKPKGHVLIDATSTDYIDPDILDLIHDFQIAAPRNDISVSLAGFKERYPRLEDRIQYVDFTTKELQANSTPEQVLELLKEGNLRFRGEARLTRNLKRQLDGASTGQFPLAAVLSCIDSRAPVEQLFDVSIGDIFTIRIAGNVISPKVLGSMEYSSAVAGVKLIVVMGHTFCGAVKAAAEFASQKQSAGQITGCTNLDSLMAEIQKSIVLEQQNNFHTWPAEQQKEYLNELTHKNVLHSIDQIHQNSPILHRLTEEGKLMIVGAIYDISTAEVTFFSPKPLEINRSKSLTD